MATSVQNPQTAIEAPRLMVFDKPTMASESQKQPAYTEEMVAAREELSEKLTALVQAYAARAGAFQTRNNAGDKWMVALTIPLGEIVFTDPEGNVRHTRNSNININALWAPRETATREVTDAAPVVAMTFEELEKARVEAAKARKAQK